MTETSHREAVKKGTVLAYFWAPWCTPCQEQEAILRGMAQKIQGVATVVGINTEEDEAFAKELEVASLPSIVILTDGQVVKRLVGVQQEKTILDSIPGPKPESKTEVQQGTAQTVVGAIGPAEGTYQQDGVEKGVNVGCFVISLVVFAVGTLLWLARPPSWGIPGLVCFIIMGIGLAGISVGWKMFKGE